MQSGGTVADAVASVASVIRENIAVRRAYRQVLLVTLFSCQAPHLALRNPWKVAQAVVKLWCGVSIRACKPTFGPRASGGCGGAGH